MRSLAATAALALLVAGAAHAQNNAPPYPQRPVRIIVNVSAGGGVDALARIAAQHYSTLWGQPFVVDNRTGAGGSIGVELVTKAAPDGYTLLVSSSTVITTAALKPQNYDPVRDLGNTVYPTYGFIYSSTQNAARYAAQNAVMNVAQTAFSQVAAAVPTPGSGPAQMLNQAAETTDQIAALIASLTGGEEPQTDKR